MMDLLFLSMTFKSWKNFKERYINEECFFYIILVIN